METTQKNITYPYIAPGKTILYVPENNEFMAAAKEYARLNSRDATMPNSSILVKDSVIIGYGANGSTYHETHGCERKRRNMPTGVGYELCKGCSPKNHGEPKAIKDAKDNGFDPSGADLYLWGHWWCCEPCWNEMIAAGIKQVYLLEGSEVLFNPNMEGNIVGKQFSEL